MATLTLTSPLAVQVSLPAGLSGDRLQSFAPFNNWLATLSRSLSLQTKSRQHPFHNDPYKLRRITVQSFDLFGDRIGFLKLQAELSNDAGESLPGSVFLRGPSVAMLVMLIPDDVAAATGAMEDDERYVILTVQARVPAGSLEFVELPAGMADDASGSFVGSAAREIKEELGMELPVEDLMCLSDWAAAHAKKCEGEEEKEGEGLPFAMFPSAGGCDEYIPIYMHERRVARAQLREWTGKLTGLRAEGERITLKLVRMRDLWKVGGRDAKALAAVALWEAWRRENGKMGKP